MKKISKRTKDENDPIKSIQRSTEIQARLTSIFNKKSIDQKDEETILKWACSLIPSERLFYLFDKIVFERLKSE